MCRRLLLALVVFILTVHFEVILRANHYKFKSHKLKVKQSQNVKYVKHSLSNKNAIQK